MPMVLPHLKFLILFTILGCGAMGCASVPANSQHDSFADYAESVFRHQSTVLSRLMMLSEADQLPENEIFANTEQAMHDACQLLNEYAERESDGEHMGLRFKAKVQASIEGCDTSIQKMEALLAVIDQYPLPDR
ncbi:hypothetical protein A1353_20620 [Methylomonas methanica]|uniref:Uncharacterized protein n=1 Tax=Methylomonas methanica TaxID=421 RepID=A0A177M3X8_METMH|nr:hypothetical protein [Methylomonas methanica]OAH99508.1 hypothetical protein A1353_20620 [Methylomonas methanica]